MAVTLDCLHDSPYYEATCGHPCTLALAGSNLNMRASAFLRQKPPEAPLSAGIVSTCRSMKQKVTATHQKE